MGTNAIGVAVDGTTIPATDHNSVQEALSNDHVPRNTSGNATAVAGSLGTSTYPWLDMFLGLAASGLSIRENAGKIAFYVGGSNVFEFDSGGLVDNSVTYDSLVAKNYVESSSSGTFLHSTTSYADVTNLSISITTTGRPVQIMVVSSGTPTGIIRNAMYSTNGTAEGTYKVLRGATVIAESTLSSEAAGGETVYHESLVFMEQPSAATYTYKVQVKAGASSDVRVANMKLVAVEL